MNAVVHFEMPYTDKARAMQFYGNVFGWTFNGYPEADADYQMAITTQMGEHMQPVTPGAINGALTKDESGAMKPVIVMEVPNTAEHIEKVKAAGGELVFGPQEVGTMGIYAQVKDTEENIIGLWQNLMQG